MRALLLCCALLTLVACNRSNQDRLPDDLSTAEGTPLADNASSGNYAEDVNAAAARDVPAPTEQSDDVEAADAADPLAPVEPPAPRAPSPPPPDVRPSFDCGLAASDVEEWICDDSDLAALDRTMAANYGRALSRADPARAAILRRSGALFLRDRNHCPDPDCVIQSYRWRLREIADIMGR